MVRNSNRKKFCEFFAGIGIVRQGLSRGHWDCVYANDVDPKKRDMYLARFPGGEHFHLEDVWNTANIIDRLNEPVLMATASFPCTDLSTAGHYRGLSGHQSSTFFAFTRILQTLRDKRQQPPLVLVENVPGLLTSKGGADFQAVTSELADLGYCLDAVIVDARHFTPQSRPRLFVIGVFPEFVLESASWKSQDSLFESHWCQKVSTRPDLRSQRLRRHLEDIDLATDWVAYDYPSLPSVCRSINEYLDLDDNQEWWSESEVDKHLEMMSCRHRAEIDQIIRNRSSFAGTIYRRKRDGGMRAEVRFDGLAGCLRTPRGGSARQIIVHIRDGATRMRWMSATEYARLQGVPNFPITVATTQAIFGFADGVCAPVIEWIDEHLLSPLAKNIYTDR